MTIPEKKPNHILETSITLFIKFGVRSVSMDDIAREAGVSKKTLYIHYKDRKALVQAAIEYHLLRVEDSCSTIFSTTENPIDQLINISMFFHDMTRQINPNLFFELSKYFPKAWKALSDHRHHYVQNRMRDNIQRGIALGLYRDDFQVEVAVRIYSCLVDLIMDDTLFPKTEFAFKELHREIVLFHLHGISTPKGIKYLNKKKNGHD